MIWGVSNDLVIEGQGRFGEGIFTFRGLECGVTAMCAWLQSRAGKSREHQELSDVLL